MHPSHRPLQELRRFVHPYTGLLPMESDPDAPTGPVEVPRGEAMVWQVQLPLAAEVFEVVRGREPGTALVVLLPPSDRIENAADLLRIVELCRPQSVLPHHPEPDPLDLQSLLRRPPDDLATEVTDYIAWRGIVLDADTRHLLRRTIEMSADLRTISGLARSLYLSRRALGRRFMSRGIPVPSHWLHLGRILRAAIALQNSAGSLFDIACDLGYPDGFSLSNQMKRLADTRPSAARDYLGTEWVLESWLRREVTTGGFSAEYARVLLPSREVRAPEAARPAPRDGRREAGVRPRASGPARRETSRERGLAH